ncbi:juvenile hormone esterase-like [Ischnura elegans]|uniref:juvenile hormone esterase-like n=1 Tax=Ischnura elegans TaxID=197161 RepID=UPI001ED88F5F|nr:juvenile hormone esterase-like [Ischnura elegans]
MGLASGALCPLLCIFVFAVLISGEPHKKADGSTVTLLTPAGIVKGTRDKSYRGRPFVSFRGIPYAKPPVGSLRFAPPEPVGPWNGVLDATKDAPLCIQKNYLVAGYPVLGQEDCLYINVYVPLNRQKPKIFSEAPIPLNPNSQSRWWEDRSRSSASSRHGSLLPVMVYIHGGGFFSGAGSSTLHGPEYIIDRDVVLVTFNYRLGALGFLSTEDASATGNWGLKDQVTALKWVQRYIRYFGGNPEKVTLFGQSAGAASVSYHMLSPMSQGLFHKAITQSGSAVALWAWPRPNARDLARRQGELVGCTHLDTSDLIDCLREAPAFNITESGSKLKVWSADPFTLFAPVIEKDCPGWPDEPFITEHPLLIEATGKFDRRLPWMVGVVPGEGIVRAPAILNDPELLSDLNARLGTVGPFLFEFDRSVVDPAKAPGVDELWNKLASCYLTSGDSQPFVGPETAQGFIDAYTDRAFLHATHKSIQLHLNNSHNPVFVYEFTFHGSLSWSRIFSGVDKDYGVSHCDDLLYLFRSPAFFPDFKPDSREMDQVDLMVTLWTNFAKFGNPTPKPIQGVTWPPATPSSPHKHLDIGEDLKVKESLHDNRIAFWNALTLLENQVTSSWVPGANPELENRLWPNDCRCDDGC